MTASDDHSSTTGAAGGDDIEISPDLEWAKHLGEARVRDLLKTARDQGISFSRALALYKASDDAGKTYSNIKDDITERYKSSYTDKPKTESETKTSNSKTKETFLIQQETTLMIKARATDWLSYAEAKRIGAVALKFDEDDEKPELYATTDPYNTETKEWIIKNVIADLSKKNKRIDPLKYWLKYIKTRPVIVLPDVFDNTLQKLKATANEDGQQQEDVLDVDLTEEEERRARSHAKNVPIRVLVNHCFVMALRAGASDIHIEPTDEALVIRNRIDGILHVGRTHDRLLHSRITSRLKILAGMDVAEKRRPQDGRMSIVFQYQPIDVRVSTFPTVHGEKIVMRLLDRNALPLSSEYLGLGGDLLSLLRSKIKAPSGLVFVCGPTGSGKTTTLYSCLGDIDKTSKNVLTIEDPVEYKITDVHQMQVNPRIGVTFASGMRTILRQDPDVIMVGECRDAETANMAIEASLTGHVVFSTIHTNDSIGVITRLLDMGLDRFLIADTLSLVIAQRLVRKVCTVCQADKTSEEILRSLEEQQITREILSKLGIDFKEDRYYTVGQGYPEENVVILDENNQPLFHDKNKKVPKKRTVKNICPNCHGKKYVGRQAIFEIFEMTTEARDLIVSDSFAPSHLRRLAEKQDMKTLIKHGNELVGKGVTTHEELVRVMSETA